MSNASMSGNIYSSNIGTKISLRNIFVAEGEKLVTIKNIYF